jgi:hypothetical protein
MWQMPPRGRFFWAGAQASPGPRAGRSLGRPPVLCEPYDRRTGRRGVTHLNFALLLARRDAAALYAAAEGLGPMADAYCLHPTRALAHVTLAQFDGLAKEAAQAAPFLGARARVESAGPYLWPGRGRHTGFTWAGVEVAATQELRALREGAVAFLAAHGAELLTPDPWVPHITLARLAAPPWVSPVPVALPAHLPAVVALGRSGPEGQFLGRATRAMRGP